LLAEGNQEFHRIWFDLCEEIKHKIANRERANIGELLRNQYQQPHRKYHNIQHIEYCLAVLEACPVVCNDPMAVRLAVFFHDAVYDTWAKDNEERSTDFAEFCMKRLCLPAYSIGVVRSCILATKHDALVDDWDQQLVADIDLFGLSLPKDEFRANTAKIRLEYFWATDKEFAQGHSAILQKLLDRPHIYQTQWFCDNFEKVAKANLTRVLRELGA